MSQGGGRAVHLTDGPLFRPLFVLSVPIVASQLMQVAYNLVDAFWVGRLGRDAVSALALSWPIVFLVISIAGGFSIAGTTLVAQNKGAGNHDRVNHVAGQTFGFVVLASVALSVVGYVATPTLVTVIGSNPSPTIHALTVEYVRTILLGVFFMFGFFMFQALLRGWGDTRTPMYLMAFGVGLNVVLDPFLILGFQGNPVFGWLGLDGLQASLHAATGFEGYGVRGAAIATVFSRAVGAVVGMGLLFSGRMGIQLSLEDLRLRLSTVRKIVRIGAPASVDESTRALGFTALTAIVALTGPDPIATLGIGSRVSSLVFLPAMGLAQGTGTVVGQNLGARRPDRAKRAVGYACSAIAAALAVVSVLSYVYAAAIFDLFIDGPGAESVVAHGTEYLHIIAPTFAFLGVFRVVAGAFQGSGNTRTAMGLTLLSLWVFRLPIAYVLVVWTDVGATGVWIAMGFSNVAAALVAVPWFLRGTWTEAVVRRGGGPGDRPLDGPSPSATGLPPVAEDVDADVDEDESSLGP